jgi:hypothetical protein
MLKKILALVFVLSVSVSGVLANSFWENLFGYLSFGQTVIVDDKKPKLSPSALGYTFTPSSGTFTPIASPDTTILGNEDDSSARKLCRFRFNTMDKIILT